jgi:hypothetical protein
MAEAGAKYNRDQDPGAAAIAMSRGAASTGLARPGRPPGWRSAAFCRQPAEEAARKWSARMPGNSATGLRPKPQ